MLSLGHLQALNHLTLFLLQCAQLAVNFLEAGSEGLFHILPLLFRYKLRQLIMEELGLPQLDSFRTDLLGVLVIISYFMQSNRLCFLFQQSALFFNLKAICFKR